MPDDFIADVEDRDLVFDRPEDDSFTLDLEDRDFSLDPSDGNIAAEFRTIGLPGPSNYQLWLAQGYVGTIDDFLAAGGGVTGPQLAAALAPKANAHDATLTGITEIENLRVTGDATILGSTTSILDGGNF